MRERGRPERWRRGWPIAVVALAWPSPANAQRAGDNAVTAAEDAFGATVGNESIGLYSTSSVRGFSPVAAGNVRIEGIYFDRQGYTSPRFTPGSTIRVGLSAQGYLFPAPTGIVDYRLQRADEQVVTSVVAGVNAYQAPFVEVDAKMPLAARGWTLAAGLSQADERYYDGSDAGYTRAALVPRWRPSDNVELLPFVAITQGRGEEAPPGIRTQGDFLPPEVRRGHYFGQRWTHKDSRSFNAGMVAKARRGSEWALAGGVFRSSFESGRAFANLFLETTREGMTREVVIADPRQRSASTSGELRVSHSHAAGPRLHTLHVSLRARDVEKLYGGSAPAFDLGWHVLGEAVARPAPASFAFGERTRDNVRQWTAGVAYEGRWREVGEIGIGVQKTDYRKQVRLPGLPVAHTRDSPLLFYGTLAAHLSPEWVLYAGYARGLEESDVAPESAANRNEALPAIRTRQIDAGLRWHLDERWRLVAGLFQVRKPYFINNEHNVYTVQGEVEHRGVELSLSGRPTDHLTLLAGTVLMDPRVTGPAVRAGRLGNKPVGQTDRMLRMNLDYQLPFPGWTIDLGASHYGERVASRNGVSRAPAYTLVDVGARYRFSLHDLPATLRAQILNVADTFAWNIQGSNSFGLIDKRRWMLSLTVDF